MHKSTASDFLSRSVIAGEHTLRIITGLAADAKMTTEFWRPTAIVERDVFVGRIRQPFAEGSGANGTESASHGWIGGRVWDFGSLF
jgi:hypothetical protein